MVTTHLRKHSLPPRRVSGARASSVRATNSSGLRLAQAHGDLLKDLVDRQAVFKILEHNSVPENPHTAQRRMSVMTIPAMDARRRRPTTLPFTARRQRWSSGEAQSSGLLRRPEDPVLLEQVINDRLRLSIDPSGE
jgi:hypothetical protein